MTLAFYIWMRDTSFLMENSVKTKNKLKLSCSLNFFLIYVNINFSKHKMLMMKYSSECVYIGSKVNLWTMQFV